MQHSTTMRAQHTPVFAEQQHSNVEHTFVDATNASEILYSTTTHTDATSAQQETSQQTTAAAPHTTATGVIASEETLN